MRRLKPGFVGAQAYPAPQWLHARARRFFSDDQRLGTTVTFRLMEMRIGPPY